MLNYLEKVVEGLQAKAIRKKQTRKILEYNQNGSGSYATISHRMANFCHQHHKKLYIGGIVGILLAAIYCYQAFSMGYVVTVAGERLFTVLEQRPVYEAVCELEKTLAQNKNITVDYRSQLQTQKTLIKNSHICPDEDIKGLLNAKLSSNIQASAIVVNGKKRIYVSEERIAEEILAELKENGTQVKDGEVLRDVILKENVEIESCQVKVSELSSKEAALSLIYTGEEHPTIYTVQSGDTLWTIAAAHNMSAEKIAVLNQINENEILSIGQELVLSSSDPYISVVATIERQETEAIPYKTEMKEDNTVNGIRIAQNGKNGEKLVSYLATRINGVTTNEFMMGETTVREAEDRIIVRGNQVLVASRGGDDFSDLYSEQQRMVYPASGTVTQYFGQHTGVDIANNIGTDILAAADGIVTYTHYGNYSYGIYCVIDHMNGFVTRYAHCSRLYVQEGQMVQAGQVIAAMGSTGHSTGPHLHFEVLRNGKFVNPFSYF